MDHYHRLNKSLSYAIKQIKVFSWKNFNENLEIEERLVIPDKPKNFPQKYTRIVRNFCKSIPVYPFIISHPHPEYGFWVTIKLIGFSKDVKIAQNLIKKLVDIEDEFVEYYQKELFKWQRRTEGKELNMVKKDRRVLSSEAVKLELGLINKQVTSLLEDSRGMPIVKNKRVIIEKYLYDARIKDIKLKRNNYGKVNKFTK